MLKITKSTDALEVSRLTVCLYSPPGLGKTSLGFTAESPILLDFDSGAYRSANRGDSVQVSTWADVENVTADDLKPYKTVVVDTAGRALDVLTSAIIDNNPKMGRGGSLTLQGYGELKSRFVAWTKLIKGFGLDVVLLAHSDEQRKGDEIQERLDVQGGSKNEIYKVSDMMGRLSIKGKSRFLNFNPTDTAFGKNPAGFPEIEVPDFRLQENRKFLATVIKQAKDKLNEASEEQKAVSSMLTDWQAIISELSTAEEFNGKIAEINQTDDRVKENVKRILMKEALSKGLEFDKSVKQFKQKEAA